MMKALAKRFFIIICYPCAISINIIYGLLLALYKGIITLSLSQFYKTLISILRLQYRSGNIFWTKAWRKAGNQPHELEHEDNWGSR